MVKIKQPFIFLGFLLAMTTTVMAAYNEAPCREYNGQCADKTACDGVTIRGLCPTQARHILCCVDLDQADVDEMAASSRVGSVNNNCGCNYDNANRATNGPAPGARRLAEHMKGIFGGRTEIYNNRNVRGGRALSLHAEGRAVDLYLDLSTGRRAFEHAVSIACSSGIQEVIFNRRIWTAQRGEHAYNGRHPHNDHVHIGLNRCGAQHFNK